MRTATLERTTRETQVQISLNLDGTGKAEIATGCGFLDHMLTLTAVHGRLDLSVHCTGDRQVDDHHLVEDTGLVLGRCIQEALGGRAGISRYGDALIPMDESLARAVVDVSARGLLVSRMSFSAAKVGDFDTELVEEFFQALAREAGITLHLEVLYGRNTHHQMEAVFKAFARALRLACKQTGDYQGVPSSKGVMG
jgi:imidazoleglycerol-phosphate dehydratase